MGKHSARTLELCASCLADLQQAGYAAKDMSTGMVVCAQCGRRCWGGAYRVEKREEREE